MRGLIEKIVRPKKKADGLQIDLYGDLTKILSIAREKSLPGLESLGGSRQVIICQKPSNIVLVDGAGCGHYLALTTAIDIAAEP